MKKYRLIVHFAEGEFMLWKDFDSMNEAVDYARMVGFATYEATNDYNLEDWNLIDPTVDATKKLSFAYNKNSKGAYRWKK